MDYTLDMRIVSDILSFAGAPVAFVQVGPRQFCGVCPWCEIDLKTVRAERFGELYEQLFDLTAEHVKTCPKRSATEMSVRTEKGV
jgi:hypothetical protein